MWPGAHFLQSVVFLFPFLLWDESQNLQVAVTVSGNKKTTNKLRKADISTLQCRMCATHTESYTPTVLRLGDGVCAPLAIVLGHIFTLLEGGCLVLQDMPDAEGIAI